jgi:hypothetical protein
MSQYTTVSSLLCKTVFAELNKTVMQDKLRNVGALKALLSNASKGNFQGDFFLRDRSTNRWQFEYEKKNCGTDGTSIDACDGGSGSGASPQGKGFFTIEVDPKTPSNSGFTTKYSKALKVTDNDILDFCSGTDSSKTAYLNHFASQVRENYINLLRAVDADLAAQLYALAATSLHPDLVTWGERYVQMLNPAAFGMVTTNPQWDVAIKTDFANLGLDYDDQIKVTTNLVEQYWKSAKQTTTANNFIGVDGTLVTDNALAIYPDNNLGSIASNNAYMLSWTPGILHLITYSKALRGISYDEMLLSQFTQKISTLSQTEGVDAAIAFALNGAKFSDSRSAESARAAFVDYSLGTPIVVDVILMKEACGDLSIQYAITYSLANLPFADFVCDGDGMTGVYAYNVGCIPAAPEPCATPVPPTPAVYLCVSADNEGDCMRFNAGDVLTVTYDDGAPHALWTGILPFPFVADTETNAEVLLNYILGQAGIGSVVFNGTSWIIMQPTGAAPTFANTDTITIASPCLEVDLTYTVATCA